MTIDIETVKEICAYLRKEHNGKYDHEIEVADGDGFSTTTCKDAANALEAKYITKTIIRFSGESSSHDVDYREK